MPDFLWVPATIAASAFQVGRNALQRGVMASSGPWGATLVRFLFGDVRVDIWVDIEDVRVPEELEAADKKGTLNGLYQFEVLAAPPGVPMPDGGPCEAPVS